MLISNVYSYPNDEAHKWFPAIPLFSKELEYRRSLGSSEVLDSWVGKLEEYYKYEGSFGVLLEYPDNFFFRYREDQKVKACAIVVAGASLHQDNVALVFGMVAEDGLGFKLLREVMREAKARGYEYLSYNKKIDLTTYITKVVKL